MSSYHGWTHRPKAQGGTDPIPAAAGSIEYLNAFSTAVQTIPTGTPTVLEFVEASGLWSSSNNFATTGNTAGAHVPATTTTDKWYVYGEAYYWAGFSVQWEAGDYPKKSELEALFTAGAQTPFFAGAGTIAPSGDAMLSVNPFDAAEPTHHTQHDLLLFVGVSDPYFRIQVTQTAGADRDVTFVGLSVIRLQTFVPA